MLNCAVGDGTPLVLWRIKPQYDKYYKGISASGKTSQRKDYVLRKAQNHLPRELGPPEELIESFSINSLSLSEIINDYCENSAIDLLQVDTEGFDDDVIYSLNLDRNRPKVINFESIHLSTQKLDTLCDTLRGYGYSIYPNGAEDMVAIRQVSL